MKKKKARMKVKLKIKLPMNKIELLKIKKLQIIQYKL